MKLPIRKPDKVLLDYINLWNEDGHYVLTVDLKDGNQVVLSEKGNIDMLTQEVMYSIIKSLLQYYARK